MQEDIENRSINLAISTTKLTGRALMNGFRKYMAYRTSVKMQSRPTHPKGKQTVKQLVGQNQGVSSLDIGNTGIRDFERIARRYGVDFAVTRNRTTVPPRYTVFFKARDIDALSAAFKEYSHMEKSRAVKPSVLKLLAKLKEKTMAAPDKNRQKTKERER